MKVFSDIQKSRSDKRNYKAIQLSNSIVCLLISDPDTQKSAAALSVGVGAFKDPLEAQGLAHYLEHMLFMGTQKYPDENQYSNFITKNSGSNNAYTGQDETNYHFEVSSTAFKETLDRFAQFFIGPLMSESSSERQLNAVDSEHKKNLNNDNWRKYQLSKHIAMKDHPYNKFSTGDKTTLTNQNLKEMLHNFYNANYSANLMKLVIYGKEPISTLEEWTVEIFSPIPNKNYEKYVLPGQPYDSQAFGKLFKIVPVKDKKTLEVQWILPYQRKNYRNRPSHVVSHLIGHEGKGSLLSYLIKEGLATELSCGGSDSYECYNEFMISIELTDKGLDKYKEILGYIFYYIEMLKKKGVPEWCVEQIQEINKMKFDFLDKKKGMMETASIASKLHKRKVEQIFIEPYLMEECSNELIMEYLNELRQDNMYVLCLARHFESECDQSEPVYSTKFKKIALEQITPLECDIDLPEQNRFIPKDLSILPMAPEKKPEQIYSSEFIQAFFKRDHFFELPKVNLTLRISFPGNNCPRERVSLAIYEEMLNEHLRQFTYLAQTAQIEAEFSIISYFSLEIKIKCYRDSLNTFLLAYLQKIFEFAPEDEKLYHTIVEKKKRQYDNYFFSDAYQLVYSYTSSSLRHGSSVLPELKQQEIYNVTLDKVKASSGIWKLKTYCEAYCGGNIEQESAHKFFVDIEEFFKTHSKPYPKYLIPQIRPVQLEEGRISVVEHKLRNKEEKNSAVEIHFQTQKLNLRSELIHKLAETIIKEPAFDFLRTKHQLGYIVFFLGEDHRGQGGFAIIVQSSVKTSFQLITYIDNFFNQHLKQILEKLDEKVFEETKAALRQSKQEDDKNLSAQTNRYWSEIVKHSYVFNKKEKQLEQLPHITLAEFKEFVNKYFYLHPKRFETHFTPDCFQEKNNLVKEERIKAQTGLVFYENIPAFNRDHMLLPDYYSPI